LRYGLMPDEGTETCTAGAGSLLLEFATLSRLLGDPIYEVRRLSLSITVHYNKPHFS
jgi:hypothetical protein